MAAAGARAATVVDLRTAAHLTIDGAAAGDTAGSAVSAGGVNGDGRPDVIIGAPAMNGFGPAIGPGAAYVLFGSATLASLDLASLTPSQGFAIVGDGFPN